MGCGNGGRTTIAMAFMSVAAISNTGTSLPAGGWMETTDADSAVSFGEMRGKINSLTVNARLEYTNDIRSVAGGINIGSTISANGILDPTTPTDISAIRAYRFFRVAWYAVGDNTNLGYAVMGGAVVLFKA